MCQVRAEDPESSSSSDKSKVFEVVLASEHTSLMEPHRCLPADTPPSKLVCWVHKLGDRLREDRVCIPTPAFSW